MPISCNPSAIVAAASCFQCISADMQKPVELYLLATIGGLATNKAGVASIVNSAKEFQDIPVTMRDAVEAYLLANLAGCQ